LCDDFKGLCPAKGIFLVDEEERHSNFLSYALVVLGLYTSTCYEMADLVTNNIKRLARRMPISFRQYTED
jgi:hypothetical protein